jgi:hypothetical protein
MFLFLWDTEVMCLKRAFFVKSKTTSGWARGIIAFIFLFPFLISFLNAEGAILEETTPTISPSEGEIVVTMTPTYVPLPTLTVPKASPTATETLIPQILENTKETAMPIANNVGLSSIGLLVLVVLIWILLAGWLYLLFTFLAKNRTS